MKEYQKIPGPYRRHVDGPDRNKLIEGEWTSPELEQTAGLRWAWTEKVDGMNIRIGWDGHKVAYGGRTDNAQIPAQLISALDALVTEEMFEQEFTGTAVTLYGEGYGAGIQKGGGYREDKSFVLFDVMIGDWWLRPDDVAGVGGKLGLDVVPRALDGSIADAIAHVRNGYRSAWNGELVAEGLVGTLPSGLCDRRGQRLIVKVKAADFGGVR